MLYRSFDKPGIYKKFRVYMCKACLHMVICAQVCVSKVDLKCLP